MPKTNYLKITEKEYLALVDVAENSHSMIGTGQDDTIVCNGVSNDFSGDAVKAMRAIKAINKRNSIIIVD